MDRQDALTRIVTVLSPYLGATMAEASTRAQCEKLGIEGATMSDEQLEALLAKLRGGLAVFVGREQAAGIVLKMRGALGGTREDGA
jgi:hypothetical protein